MQTLKDIYADLSHACDKGTTHGFIDFYDVLLPPYRETAKAVLEVGVWRGASLQLWKRYFRNASILGLDKGYDRRWGKPPLDLVPNNVDVLFADSTTPEAVSLVSPFGPFDVIIDDGSHMVVDQAATFRNFMPLLSPGGIYIIEDVGSVIEDLAQGTILERVPVSEAAAALSELDPRFRCIDLRAAKGKYNDVLMILVNS